ncbi:MAG: hypothetical protein GX483_01455 [Actinomycetaceae bacterium]|nr:hypothetical protein [Actinomycetaceae bacterium]
MMSVRVVPVERRRDFTVDERREIVMKYEDTPHGKKGTYLQSTGASPYQLERWQAQMLASSNAGR